MNIYDQALDFRRKVLAQERQSATALLQTYAQAWQDIERATQQLLAAIGDGKPTPGQLARLSQYADLLAALDRAVSLAAEAAGTNITQSQLTALRQGSSNAQELIRSAFPPDWIGFPQPAPLEALQSLAGFASDGTPLSKLLNQSGRVAADAIKDELRRAIVAGLNPREIKNRLAAIWGQSATRALTLARTEMLRSYREASCAAYEANSDVVKEWEWLCARSSRTCPACLALDGKRFKLSEPHPAHVNCRCTMIPVLHPHAQIAGMPNRQSGSDWLAGQSEADQRKVLGPKGYEAYKNGAPLADFVSYRNSKQWGKQALWKVPEVGTKTFGPVDAAGRYQKSQDVINHAKNDYEKWLAANRLTHAAPNVPKSPEMRADWNKLSEAEKQKYGNSAYKYFSEREQQARANSPLGKYLASLGAGEDKPYARGFFGAIDPARPFDKMQSGLNTLPHFSPKVQAALRGQPVDIIASEGRANYTRGKLNMDEKDPVPIWVHEFGHHLEEVLGIHGRSAEWVRAHATGPQETLNAINGTDTFSPWEMAYPGPFINPYVGKVYGKEGSEFGTEVVSVGVELIERNPTNFHDKDPAHFWYTLGTLQGR